MNFGPAASPAFPRRTAPGPRRTRRIAVCIAACSILLIALGFAGCQNAGESGNRRDGRIVIKYWEKWTGFEQQAMQDLVDKYNASQNRIYVEYLSTSQIDQKLLLATAGGNPPDVAGFWPNTMIVYASKGALTPLDRFIERDGLSMERYLPAIGDLCQYQGFVWGLPTTPSTLALHYNKRMFREAGLDPERPPRTIAELDEYAERLTIKDESGRIQQLGFNPADPGWYNAYWLYWFGGRHWDGEDTMLLDSPESIAAYEWTSSYTERYGVREIQALYSPINFSWQQYPFITERQAMVIQGVWMASFIEEHNPDLEWGAAPFPSVSEDLKDVALLDCDVLVIPKGAEHPEEAWDFIKFVQQQKNIEELCLKQRKFSPLVEVSDDFYEGHPNPYIEVFRRLAESPNAVGPEKLPVQQVTVDEMNAAFDRTWVQRAEPDEALRRAQQRVQPKLDRWLRQWKRVREERLKDWASP